MKCSWSVQSFSLESESKRMIARGWFVGKIRGKRNTRRGLGRAGEVSLCVGSAQADAMKSGSPGREPFCFRL